MPVIQTLYSMLDEIVRASGTAGASRQDFGKIEHAGARNETALTAAIKRGRNEYLWWRRWDWKRSCDVYTARGVK